MFQLFVFLVEQFTFSLKAAVFFAHCLELPRSPRLIHPLDFLRHLVRKRLLDFCVLADKPVALRVDGGILGVEKMP